MKPQRESQKKPQKKSIRDFFTVSSKPQGAAQDTAPPPPGRSHATPLSFGNTPLRQRDSTSQATGISTAPAPPTANKLNHVTSPDVPPTASQTSGHSGPSKRVVSNGEQVVLNSDSDSDSLPDLHFGGSKTIVKTVAPITRPKRTTEYDDDGLRKPERRVKSKKSQFDHVVETAQKGRELERIISEHKASLENNLEEAPAADFVFDEDILGQAIQDDDNTDTAHRVFLAMQRTHATRVESVFHFFNDSSALPAVQSKFPAKSLPEHRWTTSLRDPSTRDQAFLTGFAHQVFQLQSLPQELASWMIDQICVDRSEALNENYLEILKANDQYLHTLLDRNRLDEIFKKIGANSNCLKPDAQIAPNFVASATSVPLLPRSLKSVVRLLQEAAPWLRTKARSHAFYLLCHVCIDDRVLDDADTLLAVQDAIEAIICHFVDNSKLIQGVGSPPHQDEPQSLIASQLSDILPQLHSHITHPLLQRNLVCAFPAKSPLTAYLRRHIALSLLLHPQVLDLPLAHPSIPELVHKHLETSPHFLINRDTDYHFLAARLTLLDIAIGPGLLSVPYQPLVSAAPSQAGSSPIMAPLPGSDETKDFNKEIDALAQHIKFLGNSIMEAGAVADITILDAKDTVERLCSRLEHAVRIGGKKSYGVFGINDEGMQLKVSDIFRKVNKARNKAPGGIFDDEDDDADKAAAAQIEAETAA